jgi:hypothetical protein
MLGLSRIQLILIGTALAVVPIGIAFLTVFGKGERAGAAAVTTAVQQKTIETLDAARISRERTDEEVHRTPYDDRTDGLR